MKIISKDCKYALFKEAYQDTLSRVSGIADLIVTSPPYADARTYNNEVSWTMDDYMELGDYINLALKPGGHALVVLSAPVREWKKGRGTERGLHAYRTIIDWSDRVGLRIPDVLVYGRRAAPAAYRGRFRGDWEPIIWAQKPCNKNVKPYFNKEVLAERAKYAKLGKNVAVRKKDGEFYNRPATGWATENNLSHRGTLWNYGTVGHGHDCKYVSSCHHPATFALKLAEDIVRCFCPENGLVVDPFLGSGTSLVAAIKNGRKFIGGDLFDREDGVSWVNVAHERLAKYGLD